MRNKFFVLALGVLLSMPCMLLAEEVEIQLFEVIGMNVMPGDNPLDDPIQNPGVPPRPTSFRATINGNTLAIQKLESTIPSAQATVVNASTGNIVVNQQLTTTYQGQISNAGVYVLHIQTEGGALVGQFVVQ
jgi:hypothetical protein